MSEEGGGSCSAIPPLSCEPVTQVPIQAAAPAHVSSLPGIVLRDDRDVRFYLRLHPKSVMVLGTEVIFATE